MTTWMQDAACVGTDPEAFFPLPNEKARHALRICKGCPVKTECLDYSLKIRATAGIWGGINLGPMRLAPPRVCMWCDQEFDPTHGLSMYCARACREAQWQHRRKGG